SRGAFGPRLKGASWSTHAAYWSSTHYSLRGPPVVDVLEQLREADVVEFSGRATRAACRDDAGRNDEPWRCSQENAGLHPIGGVRLIRSSASLKRLVLEDLARHPMLPVITTLLLPQRRPERRPAHPRGRVEPGEERG